MASKEQGRIRGSHSSSIQSQNQPTSAAKKSSCGLYNPSLGHHTPPSYAEIQKESSVSSTSNEQPGGAGAGTGAGTGGMMWLDGGQQTSAEEMPLVAAVQQRDKDRGSPSEWRAVQAVQPFEHRLKNCNTAVAIESIDPKNTVLKQLVREAGRRLTEDSGGTRADQHQQRVESMLGRYQSAVASQSQPDLSAVERQEPAEAEQQLPSRASGVPVSAELLMSWPNKSRPQHVQQFDQPIANHAGYQWRQTHLGSVQQQSVPSSSIDTSQGQDRRGSGDLQSRRQHQIFEPFDSQTAGKIISMLTQENQEYRKKVEEYMKKAIKLQQLEVSYQKVEREYDDLVRHEQKREALEEQRRRRLDYDVRKLREENALLKESMEAMMGRVQANAQDNADFSSEITRLNMIIANLIQQNKELEALRDRQEIELQAQRQTLVEQRNHIQILDQALNKAQEKALQLDQEWKKNAALTGHAKKLAVRLQEEQELRLQKEEEFKRVKAQLEMDVAQLQLQRPKQPQAVVSGGAVVSSQTAPSTVTAGSAHLRNNSPSCSRLTKLMTAEEAAADASSTGGGADSEEIVRLKRELHTKQELIYSLESKVLLMESQSLSGRKEHSSAGMLAEENNLLRRTDGLQSGSEERKKWQLESRVAQLEASLAEKETLIKMLRQNSGIKLSDHYHTLPLFSYNASSQSHNGNSQSGREQHRLAAARMRLLQQQQSSLAAGKPFAAQLPAWYRNTTDTGNSAAAVAVLSSGYSSVDYSSLDRPGKHYKTVHTAGSAATQQLRMHNHGRAHSQDDYLSADDKKGSSCRTGNTGGEIAKSESGERRPPAESKKFVNQSSVISEEDAGRMTSADGELATAPPKVSPEEVWDV